MNISFNPSYPTSTYPSICAGPFTVSFSAGSISCSAEYEILLCAYDSNSYSHFSVETMDKIYLIPRWRFLDTEYNIVSSVPITNLVSGIDGVTGSASFYYVDDMPASAVYLNAELRSTINNPTLSCNVGYTSATTMIELSVGEWTPQYLKYTSDGLSDISDKWAENPIKWYATIHQELSGPIIFSHSFNLTNDMVSVSAEFCPLTAEVLSFDKMGNFGWTSGTCITNLSSISAVLSGNADTFFVLDTANICVSGAGDDEVDGTYYWLSAGCYKKDVTDDLLIYSNSLLRWEIISGEDGLEYYSESGSNDSPVGLDYFIITAPAPAPSVLQGICGATSNFLITGTSNEFIIRPFEQPFEIRRLNESWNATKSIKSYAIAPHMNVKTNLWDNFVGHSIGQVVPGQQLGRKIYERIANFPANHVDIDESNVKQLYSLSQYLDVPIDDYNLDYPPEIQRLLDIGSISHSKLWGEIVKCNLNITNEQICPRCGYRHTNLGNMIVDPFNYTVTAGVPFIQHDRFNLSPDSWTIEYPPLLSSNYQQISISNNYSTLCSANTTVQNVLSSYPFTYLSSYDIDFCSYFDFYEYINDYPRLETCDPLDGRYVQAAGVINRNDMYNTLDVEQLSTVEDWFGDGGKLQEAIEYELLRGLQLNSQTCSISS